MSRSAPRMADASHSAVTVVPGAAAERPGNPDE